MKHLVLAALGILVTLTGCAGMVAPPPVHIYSRSEMLQPGPHSDLKATGVQEYCERATTKTYATQMRNAALVNIAKACGGEENYSVLREMQANDSITVYGAFGTMATNCSHTDARAIYFKCNGTPSQSSATTK